MEEWLKKIKSALSESNPNNPTTDSVIFMLNHIAEEYKEYKSLGTVDEFRALKKIWEHKT